MNDITQYKTVVNLMRPGDIIATGGVYGTSPLIKAVTGSVVSHMLMVRQGVAHTGGGVLAVESTIEGGKAGAQTNPLEQRLANYDEGGRAWWLQLSEETRKRIDWFKFYQFIGATDGHLKYDTPGLFKFFARAVPLVGPLLFQRENATAMFCDGYAIAIFEAAGVLHGINYSKATPQDVCEMNIYSQCTQILGAPREIARFNTV